MINYIKLALAFTMVINYQEQKNDFENDYWIVSNIIVEVTDDNFISASDLTELLIKENKIQNIDFLYANYLSDIYEENYMIIGLYNEQIEIIIPNNISLIFDVTIKVSSSDVLEEKIPWYIYIFLFFKKLFQKIINFFTN